MKTDNLNPEGKEPFVFKPYTKSAFAMLYTRDTMSRRSALNWLNCERASCPGLKEELEALGYRPGQRLITIAQQRAIVEAIGEP